MAFTFNRNRKRKTYSFNRSQPSRVVSQSFGAGYTEYFDETLVAVDYSFYDIQVPVFAPPFFQYYDEDVITFSWQETISKAFNISFASTPFIALELLQTDEQDNVNVFIEKVDKFGFTASVSAPFNGQIVYRAVSSSYYPVVVSRSVASSAYYYTVSAGAYNANTEDSVVISYASLFATTPNNIFITTIDSNNNDDANVALVGTGSYGLTSTNVLLSAPISNSINYIVVK